MRNYYTEKRRAYNFIRETLFNGIGEISYTVLLYKISNEFELSAKKTLDEYLKILEKLETIKFDIETEIITVVKK